MELRRQTALFLSFLAVLTVYSANSFAADTAADNLLFRVSFDAESVDADVAGGSPTGTPHASYTPIFIQGLQGRAFQTGGSYQCVYYDTAGNIQGPYGSGGTFIFWVNPVDWDQSVRESTDRLLNFGGPGEWGYMYSWMYFSLWLGIGNSGEGWLNRTLSFPGQSQWYRPGWNQLVFTWKGDSTYIYFNGKPVDKNDAWRMVDFSGTLTLGEWQAKAPEHQWVIGLDEWRIYDRPLTDSEIAYRFHTDGRFKNDPSVLIPASAAPTIDGNINPTEWENSAEITRFLDDEGYYSLEDVYCYLMYSGSNLYLACKTPKDGALDANDKIKINIQQTYPDGTYYSLVVDGINSRNDYTETQAGVINTGWESGWTTAISSDTDYWYVEANIPLSSMGITPDSGTYGLNIQRFWSAGSADSWAWGGYFPDQDFHFIDEKMATGRMSFASGQPFVRITEISGLENSEVNVTAEIVNPTGSQKDVTVEARTNTDGIAESDTVSVAAGARESYTFSSDIKDPASCLFEITFTESSVELAKGSIWFYQEVFAPLYLRYYPSLDLIDLEVDLSLFEGAYLLDDLSLDVSIIDKASETTVFNQQYAGLESFKPRIEIQGLGLAAGTYRIAVVVLEDGQPLTTSRTSLIIKELPEWFDNNYGLEDFVPMPFTPIVRNRAVLDVWGRSHDYTNALLPAAITTGGLDLLNEPVHLEFKDGATIYRTSDSAATFSVTSETGAGSHIEWTGSVTIDNISFTTESWMDFDGFTWVKLTIEPLSAKNLDYLILKIPVKKELAVLMNNFEYGVTTTGTIPSGGHTQSLRPTWIGDEKAGIQFYSETTASWRLDNSSAAIDIIPGTSDVVLQANFIDHAMILDAPLEIEFGFIVTPIRPTFKGYLRELSNTNAVQWGYGWYQPTSEGGNPLAWPSRSLTSAAYFCASWAAAGTEPVGTQFLEILDYWYDEWIADASSKSWTPGPKSITTVSRSKSWQDFIMWNYRQMYLAQPYKGTYNDVSSIVSSDNIRAGAGYVMPDGTVIKTSDVLGNRQIQKRLYTMIHEFEPDPLPDYGNTRLHYSGELSGASLGFGDQIVDGENTYNWVTPDHPEYYNTMTLDKYRAQFMGRQFGPVDFFLPQNTRSMPDIVWEDVYPDGYREVEYISGLALLHNSALWKAYFKVEHLDPTIAAMQKYNLDNYNYDFDGYWSQDIISAVANGDPSAYQAVSIYKEKTGNRAVLILFNNNDYNGQVTLTVDWTAFGFDPAEIEIENAIHPGNSIAIVGNDIVLDTTRYVYEFIGIIKTGALPPDVNFIPPTPDDGATVGEGDVEFKAAIDKSVFDLGSINWSIGASSSFYSDALLIMYNMDENPDLGETYPKVVNCSSYVDGGTNDGTIYNGASYVTGKFGKALSFDGSNDYVAGSSNSALNYEGGDRTVSVWFKTHTTETSGGYILCKVWNFGGWYHYGINWTNDNKVKGWINGGDGSSVQSYSLTTDDAVSKEEWHHAVFTLDSSKNAKLYLDGELAKQGTHTISSWIPSYYVNAPLMIASLYPYGEGWGGNSAFSYDGEVDEVRVYDRALNADEVKQHYYSNLKKQTGTQFVFYSKQPLTSGSYNYTVSAADIYGNPGSATRDLTVSSNPDTDGDGMPDDWENAHGLNPNDPSDAGLDPDSDGLTNLEEYQNDTDPNNRDTDGDQMPDGWEVTNNLDPNADDANEDPDGDGYSNLVEYLHGTDPHNPDDYPSIVVIDQPVVTGYNLICLPLEGTGVTDAEALAQAIPNCTAVWNWNALTQSWSGHPKGGPNNFSVEPGQAYLASATGAGTFPCSGTWATPTFQLKAGYNLISLPKAKEYLTTAEELAQEVPNCTAIWKWDASTQSWVGHPLGGPNNFAVQAGAAYLVSVSADGTW